MFEMRVVSALMIFGVIGVADAQESPTPTVSPTASAPSATASLAATGAPSTSPGAPQSSPRSVKISFLPPPMEGTISLGIYDREGKLVRVLIQEGDVDEFEVGADALMVKWDGKGDKDEDEPLGKYHARGYMVGHLKIDDLGPAASPPPDLNAADHVTVKLVSNPLSKSAKLNVDLAVAIDDEQIVLKTTDGLPLSSVIETPQLLRAGITKSGEKAVDIWADGGSAVEQVRVLNVDKMMAFDAGEIELK
jgi:hypothetical protein